MTIHPRSTMCIVWVAGCHLVAAAGLHIGPRPVAPIAQTNIQTRLSTNLVAGDANDCGVLGGVNEITVSNYPTLTAAGWATLEQTLVGNTVRRVWTNAAARAYRSATLYRAAYLSTNSEPVSFAGFRHDTLANHCWTNFVARTNAGYSDTRIWLTRSHPAGWPNIPPTLAWRTNSLIYGIPGWTAISQCNEVEGSSGQVPMTAITRRHVYFRGHDTGTQGDAIKTNWHGRRVWFCDTNGYVVTATLSNAITRVMGAVGDTSYADYTVAVLTDDLPASMHVMHMGYYRYSVTNGVYYQAGPKASKWPSYACTTVPGYPQYALCPEPFLAYTAKGTMLSGIYPSYVGAWIGGDSGGAWMTPMADRLVMHYGATTSGANEEMQADLDTLTTSIGLTTNNYQITYYDFSAYSDL